MEIDVMIRNALVATASLFLLLSVQLPDASEIRKDKLVYEIVVTAPGTRSQGWKGTVYDLSGKPLEIAVGETVKTRFGEFKSVACTHIWSTCGLIRTEMVQWMKTHNANEIMDAQPWRYQLYVIAPNSKSEGYEGVLVHGPNEIGIEVPTVETPMGLFVSKGRSHLWDRGGWYHMSWPEAR
jgi:hypothetical protein